VMARRMPRCCAIDKPAPVSPGLILAAYSATAAKTYIALAIAAANAATPPLFLVGYRVFVENRQVSWLLDQCFPGLPIDVC
jgi:hypothetical protein